MSCNMMHLLMLGDRIRQEENEALQQLVLDMAANKKDARQRVAGLRQKFNDLVSEVRANHCRIKQA